MLKLAFHQFCFESYFHERIFGGIAAVFTVDIVIQLLLHCLLMASSAGTGWLTDTVSGFPVTNFYLEFIFPVMQGSVSISMSLFQSSMCFVCSHLTSGQKEGAEQRRNADVYEILRRTCFSTIFDTNEPQTIPSHE